MATPSIAMIPSGYKATKVYSVLPTNGDGDLTFDRNSTGTRVNKSGLIEEIATDVPRLDYSDGSCPSLLLEPASLNLVTYSQDFTPNWTFARATRSITNELSPSGDLGVVLATAEVSVVSNTHRFYSEEIPVLTNDSFSTSLFVKKGTSSKITMELQTSIEGDLGFSETTFDFDNETITNGTFEKLQNGWYRIKASGVVNQDTNARLFIYIHNQAGSKTYIADGSETISVWGAQLEENQIVTSYMPTTSGTASRSADSASKTGLSSYINDSEGVLYAEISALGDDLTFRNISLSDSSLLNRIYIRYSNVSNIIQVKVDVSSVNQVSITQAVSDITSNTKVAFRYKANDFSLFINGSKYVGTPINGGGVPSGLNRLGFDYGIAGADFYGKVRDARVYNTSLTDLELQTLTTI